MRENAPSSLFPQLPELQHSFPCSSLLRFPLWIPFWWKEPPKQPLTLHKPPIPQPALFPWGPSISLPRAVHFIMERFAGNDNLGGALFPTRHSGNHKPLKWFGLERTFKAT